MNSLRLLAWLLILIVALGIAVSMLPRETSLPSSQLVFPNLDTHVSKLECVNEAKIYPDVNSLSLHVDFGGKEIKAGGAVSTSESLFPLLRGDYGYVDPVLYYKALATYLALFPVELNAPSRSYVIAPLPYDESQGDEWVGNRTLCLSYPWLHVNPVEPVLRADNTSLGEERVKTPMGILLTTRLALTYLPSFNISFNYSLNMYEHDYARGYAYSWHNSFIADIEDMGCYIIDNVSYCIRVYVYNITWHYYLALYNSTSGYWSTSSGESYVYSPLSGELYVERTLGNFMGYPLAKAYLSVKPILYYQSVNESYIEIVYDAEVTSGYISRGVKAVSYFIAGNVSWTPYTGLNPVLKLNNSTVSTNPYPVSAYISPLQPVKNTLLFTAEDEIELYNDLTYVQRAYRGINATRRVTQLNITYDTAKPVIEITRDFLNWRGDAYIKPRLNITLLNPPIVNITEVREELIPHPGELWLARAYANATAKTIESVVDTIDEYRDTYRYLLSAMLLSSTSTVESDASVNPVLAIRDVLEQGKGSPREKSSILSMILAELGVKHELREAISRYIGVSRETLAVYTYVNDIPGLWQLPATLAKRENNTYTVLYDPWQNTVFCDHGLVEEIHGSS